MPTDRELALIAQLKQSAMEGTVPPTPVTQPPVIDVGRAAAVPSVAAMPGGSTPQSEPTGIQIETYDYSGKPIIVFSNDGVKKVEADFDKAIATYNNSQGKKTPKGFAILGKDTIAASLRTAFENVNQPVQAMAADLSQRSVPGSPGQPGAGGGSGNPGNPLAGILQLGKMAATSLIQANNTPEKAMQTAGQVAAGVATKGMSPLLQAVGQGLGYAGGDVVGKLGFGYNPSESNTAKMVIGSATAAATRGALGVLEHWLGTTTSQRARDQVAEGLMKLLKERHAGVTASPDKLLAMMDNPADLTKMVQIGARALMGDVDDISTSLMSQIRGQVNLRSNAVAEKEINGHVSNFTKAAQDAVNNIGDVKALTAAKQAMDDAIVEIGKVMQGVLKKNFNANSPAYNQRFLGVYNVLDGYKKGLSQFDDGMRVLTALKKAGGDSKFDVAKYQQEILPYFKGGSSLMEESGKIAGRGADLSEGTDRLFPSTNVNKVLGMLGFRIPGTPQSYVGKVRGTTQIPASAGSAAAARMTSDSVKSFFGQD